jgi:putative transposase
MEKETERYRIIAVKRFINGESSESICTSLGRSRSWLYKWIKRYREHDDTWSRSQSRCPHSSEFRTAPEIVEVVKMVRLNLYNQDLFCGAQAIRWELEDIGIKPLPSLRTINRILSRNELTHRRTGKYASKGTVYPTLPSLLPNQTHQADLVGPCYLKGPVRFYSLNVIDTATVRCGLHPALYKSGQAIFDGLWAIWKRMGIPDHIQVDNAMSFFGSPTHPRGMGPLIRLCLHNEVEPWFIPMAEPWRNGIIESFNDRYQQMFLAKQIMLSASELEAGSLAFEQRHNSKYRYSKIGGKTPLKALAASTIKLRFPGDVEPPRHRLTKPTTGRYHLVRLIRSDLKINIFGELFQVPPELMYEYIVATINVKDQKLQLFLGKSQIEEYDYKLR